MLTGLCLAFVCATFALTDLAAARPAYGTQALIRLIGHRPGIMVAINGYGPFPFLIDTATSHSVIVPGLRERLAIAATPGPAYSVVTAAGSVRSHFHIVREIAAAGVIVEGVHAVVIDLPPELGVMGILGADFLSNFTVDLDLRARKITLYPEKTLVHVPGFQSVRGIVDSAGFIVVPARVDGIGASAVFDTGAGQTVANPRLAVYTNRAVKAVARNIDNKIVDAARLRGWAESHSFARISVGPASWRDRQVMIANMRVFEQIGLDARPALFIGMDFIAGRRVILDYANATLSLAP